MKRDEKAYSSLMISIEVVVSFHIWLQTLRHHVIINMILLMNSRPFAAAQYKDWTAVLIFFFCNRAKDVRM